MTREGYFSQPQEVNFWPNCMHYVEPHYQSCEIMLRFGLFLSGIALQTDKVDRFSKVQKACKEKAPAKEKRKGEKKKEREDQVLGPVLFLSCDGLVTPRMDGWDTHPFDIPRWCKKGWFRQGQREGREGDNRLIPVDFTMNSLDLPFLQGSGMERQKRDLHFLLFFILLLR